MRASAMVFSAALAVAAFVPTLAWSADLEYDRQACRPGTAWDGYACVPARPPAAYAPPVYDEEDAVVEAPPVYVAPVYGYAAPAVTVYAGPRYYWGGPRYGWGGPRYWARPHYAWAGPRHWRR